MPALPGWGCWAEAPRDAGGRRRSQAVAGVGHFPRTPLSCAHLVGSLHFSHRTGSGKVNALLLLKMGPCGREILLVYLPERQRLFIALMVKGRKMEGVYKVKLICMLSNVAFTTRIWTLCVECVVVAVQTPL